MASQFDMIQKQILERQDKIFRGSIIQLSTMIVNNTPVDEGALKASFIFSIGSPSSEVRESGDSIESIKISLNDFKIGQTGYMTNAQEHAIPNEFGWSAQAPNGMVRKNVAKWASINEKVTRAIR